MSPSPLSVNTLPLSFTLRISICFLSAGLPINIALELGVGGAGVGGRGQNEVAFSSVVPLSPAWGPCGEMRAGRGRVLAFQSLCLGGAVGKGMGESPFLPFEMGSGPQGSSHPIRSFHCLHSPFHRLKSRPRPDQTRPQKLCFLPGGKPVIGRVAESQSSG